MSDLKVGGNVDGWCTKCKLVLAHTIEVLVGSEIKRVCCNTCKGKHQHKANPPGTKTASTKAPKTPRFAAAPKATSYAALLESHHNDLPVDYSFEAKFLMGALLKHDSFGVGIVTADKGGNKIEVLFPTGPKILVHARA
ncbi:MAG: hypothetical protein WCK49_06295 [Myxococcaceae bacterium]